MTLVLPDYRRMPASTRAELRASVLAPLDARRPFPASGRPWRVAAPVALTALAAHALTVALWPSAHLGQIDLEVYRAGGATLLAGEPLYAGGVLGRLPFTYPPAAAVLFTPLALVPFGVAGTVMMLGNFGLLVLTVRRCWRALGLTGAALWPLTLLGAAVALWTEPVRTTVGLGQVNLVLLAIVLWDLLRPASRWQGVGVGLAAGIKLTPLLFVPFLLLTGRFRAAAVATGAFAGTVAAGFALAPGDSATYWLSGVFTDSTRVGATMGVGNQSLRGMVVRWLGVTGEGTLVWLGAAVLVGAVALLVAAAAHRRGHDVLGVAITGLAAAAVSPFSWPHHWVYFVPLGLALSWLIASGSRSAWPVLAVALAGTLAFLTDFPSRASGAIPGLGVLSLDLAGVPGWLCHNVYPVVFMIVTCWAAWSARPRSGRNADRRIGYLPA